MSHTNINIDAIEQALPAGYAAVKEKIIQWAIKNINIWLTPDPKIVEDISISIYHYGEETRKIPLDINNQRALLEKMFDDNHSLVFINRTREKITETFFGGRQSELVTEENKNYVFSTTARDLEEDIRAIQQILSALRNPRVALTLEEHNVFVSLLGRFKINLTDYYI